MADWIKPCNPQNYRIVDALRELRKIDYSWNPGISVGDFVYIYISRRGNQVIRFKCRVNKTGLAENEIDDVAYVINQGNLPGGDKMEIEVIEEYPERDSRYSLNALREHGLESNLQSDYKLDNHPSVKEYLDSLSGTRIAYQNDSNGPNSVQKDDEAHQQKQEGPMVEYQNPLSKVLLKSKNFILHGAPGTGKTYLAKQIAVDIITDGASTDYDSLTEEQKRQIEFVQFHPSYDYSDFVEGLRPRINVADDTLGFDLKDGIFKSFVARARENYENSEKSDDEFNKVSSVQDAMTEFFSDVLSEENFGMTFGTKKNKFIIKSVDDNRIEIFIPDNDVSNKLYLKMDEIRKLLESDKKFEKVGDVADFFNKKYLAQGHSYELAIYKEIKKKLKSAPKSDKKQKEKKEYVFIIDEINRGEISKIFGELFFAIDPGYRGRAGEISTQYSSLHSDPSEKFYIPDNLYIIGTMNDIDRSVDSFDFAMRRRFRFIEIKADKNVGMLDVLGPQRDEAVRRMRALNAKIKDTPDLNENYQIGAAYFLKLKERISFDQLWEDYLKPLLEEYIRGMNDEEEIMRDFERAYGYPERQAEAANDAQNQG